MQRLSEAVKRELEMQRMPKKREMVTIPSVPLVFTKEGTWEMPLEKQEPLLCQARRLRPVLLPVKRAAEMASMIDTTTPTDILTPLLEADVSSDAKKQKDMASTPVFTMPSPAPPQSIWHDSLPPTQWATQQPPTVCLFPSATEQPPDVCLFSSGMRSDRRHRRPGLLSRPQTPPTSDKMDVDDPLELLTTSNTLPSGVSHQRSTPSGSRTSTVFSAGSSSTASRMSITRRTAITTGRSGSSRTPPSTLPSLPELEEPPNETPVPRWCPGNLRDGEIADEEEEPTACRLIRRNPVRSPGSENSSGNINNRLKLKVKRTTRERKREIQP